MPPFRAAPSAPPTPPEPPQSIWSEHDNRTITWRTNDGLHTREMRVHGDVHFNDKETDVKSMSTDG